MYHILSKSQLKHLRKKIIIIDFFSTLHLSNLALFHVSFEIYPQWALSILGLETKSSPM